MSSVFDSICAGMSRDNQAVMGVSATFAPSGGEPVELTVWHETELVAQTDGFSGQVWALTETVEALSADLGSVPNRGDVFVIDGLTKTVARLLENDGEHIKTAVK